MAITSTTGLVWSAQLRRRRGAAGQVVNGVPITYTLDLAAPLVTVLAEAQLNKRTTYLYGLGDSPLAGDDGVGLDLPLRPGCAQQRAPGDGRCRAGAGRAQLRPYGVPLSGDGGEPFGFTGEYRDEASGLVFLRARYLQVTDGRFITRDTWPGDDTRPISFSGWIFGNNNPVRFTDSSGNRVCEDADCKVTVPDLPRREPNIDKWIVAHNLADLQREPELILLTRLAFGEGRNETGIWVANSIMVRAKENYLGFGTTVREQILPQYPPSAPYQVLWVTVGCQTAAEAKAAGTLDNMEITMDPTQLDPAHPETGVAAFKELYDKIEPVYDAVMVRGDTSQLPKEFQGENALDSFGGGVPRGINPALAVPHGDPPFEQWFYPSGAGQIKWPW